MEAPKNHLKLHETPDWLDRAGQELYNLLMKECANSASGDFGVVVTLDRGDIRRVRLVQETTIRH